MWTDLLTPGHIGSYGTLLLVLGGGLKYIIARADSREAEREKKIDVRIAALESQIADLRRREDIYQRRVITLEATMAIHGITAPATPGWPLED